jgi:hypothetical protein
MFCFGTNARKKRILNKQTKSLVGRDRVISMFEQYGGKENTAAKKYSFDEGSAQ